MSEAFRSKVRRQILSLFPRLRHSVAFPLPIGDIYDAAFGNSKLGKWMAAPREGTLKARYSGAERNLIACTHRELIVHFYLSSPEEIDDPSVTFDEIERFWIRFPHEVGCPPNGGGFLLSESMRCNKQLLDWYNSANRVENAITHYTTKLYQLLTMFANASELALAFPEIAGAVPGIVPPSATLRAAARSQRIRHIRSEVLRYLPPDEMDVLTTSIASALMLPPAPLPNAWVGLYDIGLEA